MTNPPPQHRDPDSQYESLDYEVYETLAYRQRQAAWTSRDQTLYTSLKWILCLLLAVLLSAISFLVNLGVENVGGIKFRAATVALQTSGPFAAVAILLAVNCSLVLVASVITVYYAPVSAGSGIPEVKAFLNGVDVPDIYSLSALFGKVVGITFVVASSLPLGKEGPFTHIGAAVASLLAVSVPRWTVGSRQSHANHRDRRDLVTAGTAAGVSSAFRAPIGGILFALEEMTNLAAWRPHLLWRVFFSCALVVFLARPLTRLCYAGACGFSARGAFIIYEIASPQTDFFLSELLPLLLIGVIGGLLGAGFIRLNDLICRWRKDTLHPYLTFSVPPLDAAPRATRTTPASTLHLRPPPNFDGSRVGKVLEALFATCVITIASYALASSAPCIPCPAGVECPGTDGRFVQLSCSRGSYNDLATLLFNTQDDAIRALFSSGTDNHFRYASLLLFAAFYLLTFAWTFGMSFPAGSLVPAIVAGAAFGRAVGRFAVRETGTASTGSLGPSGVDASTYALLGSAALLSGVLRSTASICVILLEVTNNLQLLPMLMLVTLVAKFVADTTGTQGLFETALHTKGLPFLELAPPRSFRNFTAGDALACAAGDFDDSFGPGEVPTSAAASMLPPRPLDAPDGLCQLPKIVRVRELLAVLRSTTHNAFPVVSSSGRQVLGLVLRSDLIRVLRSKRCLQTSEALDPAALEEAESLVGTILGEDGHPPLTDTGPGPLMGGSGVPMGPAPSMTSAVEKLEVLVEGRGDLGKYLNLSPFLNPSPLVVQSDTSLTKVYNLFLKLQLRHLLVVPRVERAVGVLTRHDLLPDKVHRRMVQRAVRSVLTEGIDGQAQMIVASTDSYT